MSPSAESKWASRQDFTTHNEVEFYCETAKGGMMTIMDVNTAIKEFVSGDEKLALD